MKRDTKIKGLKIRSFKAWDGKVMKSNENYRKGKGEN